MAWFCVISCSCLFSSLPLLLFPLYYFLCLLLVIPDNFFLLLLRFFCCCDLSFLFIYRLSFCGFFFHSTWLFVFLPLLLCFWSIISRISSWLCFPPDTKFHPCLFLSPPAFLYNTIDSTVIACSCFLIRNREEKAVKAPFMQYTLLYSRPSLSSFLERKSMSNRAEGAKFTSINKPDGLSLLSQNILEIQLEREILLQIMPVVV